METYGIHSFIHSIINSHYVSDLHQADGSLSGSPFKPAQLKHAFLLVTAMVLVDHCNSPAPHPPNFLPIAEREVKLKVNISSNHWVLETTGCFVSTSTAPHCNVFGHRSR